MKHFTSVSLKERVWLGILLASSVILTGCQEEEKLFQAGYFKDSLNNRVFVLVNQDDLSDDLVEEHLQKLMHTSGQMTLAYVFEGELSFNGDKVTLAPNFLSANEALVQDAPQWRWWYRQNPSGEVTIVDCSVETENTACGQNK